MTVSGVSAVEVSIGESDVASMVSLTSFEMRDVPMKPSRGASQVKQLRFAAQWCCCPHFLHTHSMGTSLPALFGMVGTGAAGVVRLLAASTVAVVFFFK